MTKAWDPVEEAKAIQTPEVGKVLPGTKYLIVAKLGRGGMGEVFEVVKPPQIMGVLKRMAPEVAKLAKAKQLFLTEVQALAELDHPHIVRVHDFDSDAFGVPFMVMERLTGRTVGSLIDKRGKVEPEEAYEITRQLLDALHCAHTHETPVVHRDIKPDNIFLHQPRHGQSILKLIDFGLAAESGVQEKDFAGSVHYAAPEQMFGERVTASADLYAVGAVLYEMLSGRMPYDAPTPTEIGRNKKNLRPPPLAKLAPWVPNGVARLVLRALEPDPSARPESAKAFREELDRAVGVSASPTIVAPSKRAAIPAVTKVGAKVPLPSAAELAEVRSRGTAPLAPARGATEDYAPSREPRPLAGEVASRPGFSRETLLHAGLPGRFSLRDVWREVLAGVGAGAVALYLFHLWHVGR